MKPTHKVIPVTADRGSFAFSSDGLGASFAGDSSQGSIPSIFTVGLRKRGEPSVATVTEADTARSGASWPESLTAASYTHHFDVDESLTIYVQVEDLSTETHLRFEVENNSSFVVEWIELCSIEIEGGLEGDGGSGSIVWPWNEGALIHSLKDRADSWFDYREIEYPSHGVDSIYPGAMESQFLAYCSPAGGFYLGAHDPAGRTKMVDFRETPRGVELVIRHYLSVAEHETLRVDYPTVIASFVGDWHVPAQIHRNWLDHSGHLIAPSPEELPSWYSESPVVVTFPVRGTHDTGDMSPNGLYPYPKAVDAVEAISSAVNSQILALLMHWEGTAPWAPPYVWPPFGGAEAFESFVDDIHERGHLAGVYCSGLGWTLQSKLVDYALPLERALPMACAGPVVGDVRSVICTDQRIGVDLCAGSEEVREILIAEVSSISSSNLDYIQLMDQNHGGTSYFCYESSHGHEYGPSDWTVGAVRALGSGIRQIDDVATRPLILGCESAAADTFIRDFPFSDARFNLIYEIGHPIPLYQFLYHELVHNFMGNQVNIHQFIDIARSPDNLFMRLAHSFAAGDIMTLTIDDVGRVIWGWGVPWADPQPSTPNVTAFVSLLNRWRSSQFLHHFNGARMQAPLKVTATKNDLHRVSNPPLPVSDVISTRWLLANGNQTQLIVNYRSVAVTVTVGDALEAFEWFALDPDEGAREKLTGTTWELAPNSVLLLGSNA